MAPTVNLTDGTTTINLNNVASGPIRTLDSWQPSMPQTSEETNQNLGDGDTLSVPTWRNVTETVPLLISGTASTIATQVQNLQKMLNNARLKITPAYLQVQYDHDSNLWRSEVLAGRLVLGEADRIALGNLEVTLIVTRRYFWEGPETQLALTSAGTGTATTGYVTVYNDDDATANTNWFQASAAQVTGDLPSPLKIELKNNSGASRTIKNLYLGNYTWMAPASIDPIVRGGTNTWATDPETVVTRWALSSTLLSNLDGRYVRVLVAFSDLPASDCLLRASLQLNAGSYFDLLVGEQVLGDGNAALDLGAMPLPPNGYATSTADLYVALKAQRAGGDAITVDWMQLFPAGHGLFRCVSSVASTAIVVPDGDGLVDDGIGGVLYGTDGTNSWPYFRGFGSPLHVWPGKNNRMRLLIQGASAMETGHAWQVKAWYRPRRLSV